MPSLLLHGTLAALAAIVVADPNDDKANFADVMTKAAAHGSPRRRVAVAPLPAPIVAAAAPAVVQLPAPVAPTVAVAQLPAPIVVSPPVHPHVLPNVSHWAKVQKQRVAAPTLTGLDQNKISAIAESSKLLPASVFGAELSKAAPPAPKAPAPLTRKESVLPAVVKPDEAAPALSPFAAQPGDSELNNAMSDMAMEIPPMQPPAQEEAMISSEVLAPARAPRPVDVSSSLLELSDGAGSSGSSFVRSQRSEERSRDGVKHAAKQGVAHRVRTASHAAATHALKTVTRIAGLSDTCGQLWWFGFYQVDYCRDTWSPQFSSNCRCEREGVAWPAKYCDIGGDPARSLTSDDMEGKDTAAASAPAAPESLLEQLPSGSSAENQSASGYDCQADAANWKVAWERQKKQYCCSLSGLGCEGGSYNADGTYVYDAGEADGEKSALQKKADEDEIYGSCDACCSRDHVLSPWLVAIMMAPLICFKMCICMCIHTITGNHKSRRHDHMAQ